jgi:hypothetical protein
MPASRRAGLAAKRHRLLSGFENSDIAFLIAFDFTQAQADEGWWTKW